MFTDKIVVVTGGAHGIGAAICDAFKEKGAKVCVIDKLHNEYFTGDISDGTVLEKFAAKVISDFGKVDFIVNNACLSKGGIEMCSYDDFNYVLRTGVSAPFMLAKLFKDNFNEGACIVNISSTRSRMSHPDTESYTAAKGGIGALTHALAVSLAGKVRVNSISPGWIATGEPVNNVSDNAQHPAGRVGKTSDIAEMVLFLCSEKAAFITGEDITIDGGMTRLMIYHDDYGWAYDPGKG